MKIDFVKRKIAAVKFMDISVGVVFENESDIFLRLPLGKHNEDKNNIVEHNAFSLKNDQYKFFNPNDNVIPRGLSSTLVIEV
jgi:hypothetical protein